MIPIMIGTTETKESRIKLFQVIFLLRNFFGSPLGYIIALNFPFPNAQYFP